MQGRSFWPLLCGRPYQPHAQIFMEFNEHGQGDYDPMRAVRTPRFHYIRNFADHPLRHWLPAEVQQFNDTFEHWVTELWPAASQLRPVQELYDVAADPHETTNLIGHPAYSQVGHDLDQALKQWMQDTNDPLLSSQANQTSMKCPA
jgi:hypothetical protein